MNTYNDKTNAADDRSAATAFFGKSKGTGSSEQSEKSGTSITKSTTLQALANNSSRVKQLKAVQRLANDFLSGISLDTQAPVQMLGEETEAVKEVREKIPDGPGNLTSSSSDAKKKLSLARDLETKLLEEKNLKRELINRQSSNELGRDALYRKYEMNGDNLPVYSYINETKGEAKNPRGKFLNDKRNNTVITETVWQAFILAKTGGGACDHISAATFLSLVKKGKKPVLVSYEPQSDEEYSIKNIRGGNKHSSVTVREDESDKIREVDSWWPDKGRVRLFESKEAVEQKLGKYQEKLVWQPEYEEFADAVWDELESRYRALTENKELETEGKEDNVHENLWDITENVK